MSASTRWLPMKLAPPVTATRRPPHVSRSNTPASEEGELTLFEPDSNNASPPGKRQRGCPKHDAKPRASWTPSTTYTPPTSIAIGEGSIRTICQPRSRRLPSLTDKCRCRNKAEGVSGVSRRAKKAGEGGNSAGSRFTSDSGRVGARPRPDANGRLRADPVVPARNGIAQYESVQSHLCSWSAYGAPVHGMALDDERQDTRRGVLKNLAAAGLGAAIGTVAARQFPPWPSEPGVGVPEIAGPGTLDAVFNVRDQGAVGDGAADDTGALIRTIGRVPASGGLVYLPRGTYRATSTIPI